MLKDVLFLLALSVESRAARVGLRGRGVTLKLTYADMKSITRSRANVPCDSAVSIWQAAVRLLEKVEQRPVRLVGVSLYNLTDGGEEQLRLDEFADEDAQALEAERRRVFEALEARYHLDFAGHVQQLQRSETLHKTAEYMRKHFDSQ